MTSDPKYFETCQPHYILTSHYTDNLHYILTSHIITLEQIHLSCHKYQDNILDKHRVHKQRSDALMHPWQQRQSTQPKTTTFNISFNIRYDKLDLQEQLTRHDLTFDSDSYQIMVDNGASYSNNIDDFIEPPTKIGPKIQGFAGSLTTSLIWDSPMVHH